MATGTPEDVKFQLQSAFDIVMEILDDSPSSRFVEAASHCAKLCLQAVECEASGTPFLPSFRPFATNPVGPAPGDCSGTASAGTERSASFIATINRVKMVKESNKEREELAQKAEKEREKLKAELRDADTRLTESTEKGKTLETDKAEADGLLREVTGDHRKKTEAVAERTRAKEAAEQKLTADTAHCKAAESAANKSLQIFRGTTEQELDIASPEFGTAQRFVSAHMSAQKTVEGATVALRAAEEALKSAITEQTASAALLEDATEAAKDAANKVKTWEEDHALLKKVSDEIHAAIHTEGDEALLAAAAKIFEAGAAPSGAKKRSPEREDSEAEPPFKKPAAPKNQRKYALEESSDEDDGTDTGKDGKSSKGDKCPTCDIGMKTDAARYYNTVRKRYPDMSFPSWGKKNHGQKWAQMYRERVLCPMCLCLACAKNGESKPCKLTECSNADHPGQRDRILGRGYVLRPWR
jgi:hypothetical protein